MRKELILGLTHIIIDENGITIKMLSINDYLPYSSISKVVIEPASISPGHFSLILKTGKREMIPFNKWEDAHKELEEIKIFIEGKIKQEGLEKKVMHVNKFAESLQVPRKAFNYPIPAQMVRKSTRLSPTPLSQTQIPIKKNTNNFYIEKNEIKKGGDIKMKKCKSCQKEIDPKATKCPYCQTDQRSWFMKHPILTVILALFIIGLFSAATKSGSKSDGQKIGETNPVSQSSTNTSQQEVSQPTVAPAKAYKMGDLVDLDGKTIVVNDVAPYTSNNQFMVPKSGNKYMSVDLTLTNNSKDAFSYNVLNFRLQDDKDYSYDHAVSDQEPYLTVGAIQPGEKVRGFITYEIPQGNTPAKLIFTPGFLSTSQIIITLTK